MKKLVVIALVGTLLGLAACEKESDSGGTTQLRVNLTDNPYNATEVNVEILGVKANFSNDNDGWIDLNTQAGVYNLLGLQNGVDTLLAVGTVPLGILKEIRLVLGSDNSIMVDNVLYPLTIPSGSESGLKIKVDKSLNATMDSILVDFDAGLSILQTGAGEFKLKPVLKLK